MDSETYAQGAADNACYDFLKDVMRIEKLLTKSDNQYPERKKGFAVIMTNYNLIYGENTRQKEDSAYYPFVLKGEKDGVIRWKNDKATSKERNNPIELKNKYRMEWKDYFDLKKINLNVYDGLKELNVQEYKLKYMVLEIRKNEKM